MKTKFNLPEGFTITAHTGCEGTEYNSLESIRVGAQYGEIIEVDLNFTKDKKAVLAHTFAKSDSVPIDDVFALLAELPDKKMNIDVKIAPDLRAVYNSAVKYGVLDRIFFTGIDKLKLEPAKNVTPEIPFYINLTVTRLGMLRKGYIESLIKETKKHSAFGLNTSYKACTKELVDAFHKEGLLVSLYTCNDEKSMVKALSMGADNITTRQPKKLKRLISAIQDDNCTLTAHTGCSGTKDNSLEAMEVGIKNGADIVEFDLRFDKNGVPVLSHDAPKGGEVTLEEAFSFLSKHPEIKANVDVKITTNLKQVEALAEKYGVLSQIFYTGIEEKFVPDAKKESPKIPYFLNLKVNVAPEKQTKEYVLSLVDKVKKCGAIGINFNHKNASQLIVDTFREEGLLVSIWTIKTEKELYKALSLCPDNITTRKPELLKSIILK